MNTKLLSADEIFSLASQKIAMLDCQESYARRLSSIFAYHIKKNKLMDIGVGSDTIPCHSALVVSPTGSGKTFLFKSLASVLNINSIVIDCTSLSREGWKGASLGQQLLAAKDSAESEEHFSNSILFLDEIDKLKLDGTVHDTGSPMDNLLQLYNGGKIAVEINAQKNVEFIDVSRFTIIAAGAFSGIETIIKERLSPKTKIGFSCSYDEHKIEDDDLFHHVTISDLERYGIKRELLGRISTIITILPMKEADYRALLVSNHGSVKERYQTFFNLSSGVDFDISDNAVSFIARKCISSGTGARAVNGIISDAMSEAITVVDGDTAINKIILDADENQCCLTYRFGERSSSAISEHSEVLAPYCIQAENICELSNKICNLYQEAECNEQKLDEFRTFTNISLEFLHNSTPVEDFNFGSLLKLASTVRKTRKNDLSTFDVIMSDVNDGCSRNDNIEEQYKDFQRMWDSQTANRLCIALNRISSEVKKRGLGYNIKFELVSVSKE